MYPLFSALPFLLSVRAERILLLLQHGYYYILRWASFSLLNWYVIAWRLLGWDHFTILQHSLYFGALVLKNFNQISGGVPIHCSGCLESAVLSESTWFTCQINFFSIDTVMSLLWDSDSVRFCLNSLDRVLYGIQILNFDWMLHIFDFSLNLIGIELCINYFSLSCM